MSTVREIQEAISRLSANDRAALRDWLVEADNQAWDEQFEEDVAAGRLDWLRDEGRADLRAGRCTDR